MKRTFLKLIVFLLTLSNAWSNASDWMQGSFLIHEISEGVSLSELGATELAVSGADLPLGIGGRFSCRADPGAGLLLSASNGLFVQLSGAGELGVERFEQTKLAEAGPQAVTLREDDQSRMLFSFRSGHLYLDTRELNEASRVAVETPLGRIAADRALWQMRIAFDQRSGIFNFEIACSEGRLRFTDRRELNYALRAGQRLTGAGRWANPGIDVVEMTGNDREAMEAFLSRRENAMADANRLEPYLPTMDTVSSAALGPQQERALPPRGGGTRPVIIEYAPRPETLTPFRAEMPPPSARQADIF